MYIDPLPTTPKLNVSELENAFGESNSGVIVETQQSSNEELPSNVKIINNAPENISSVEPPDPDPNALSAEDKPLTFFNLDDKKIPKKIRGDIYTAYRKADDELIKINNTVLSELDEKYKVLANNVLEEVKSQYGGDNTVYRSKIQKLNDQYRQDYDQVFKERSSDVMNSLKEDINNSSSQIQSVRRLNKLKSFLDNAKSGSLNLGYTYTYDSDPYFTSLLQSKNYLEQKSATGTDTYKDIQKKISEYYDENYQSIKPIPVVKNDEWIMVDNRWQSGLFGPKFAVDSTELNIGDKIKVPDTGMYMFSMTDNGYKSYQSIAPTGVKVTPAGDKLTLAPVEMGVDKLQVPTTVTQTEEKTPGVRTPYYNVVKRGTNPRFEIPVSGRDDISIVPEGIKSEPLKYEEEVVVSAIPISLEQYRKNFANKLQKSFEEKSGIKDKSFNFSDILINNWNIYERGGIIDALRTGPKQGKYKLPEMAEQFTTWLSQDENYKNVNVWSAENLTSALSDFSKWRSDNLNKELEGMTIKGMPAKAFMSAYSDSMSHLEENSLRLNDIKKKISIELTNINNQLKSNPNDEALLKRRQVLLKTDNNNTALFNNLIENNKDFLSVDQDPEFIEASDKMDQIRELSSQKREMFSILGSKYETAKTTPAIKGAEQFGKAEPVQTGFVPADMASSFYTNFYGRGLDFLNSVSGVLGQLGAYATGQGRRGSQYAAAAAQRRGDIISSYIPQELPEIVDGKFSFGNYLTNMFGRTGSAVFDMGTTLLAPELRILKGATWGAKYLNRLPGLVGTWSAGNFYNDYNTAKDAGIKSNAGRISYVLVNNLLQSAVENIISVKDLGSSLTAPIDVIKKRYGKELLKYVPEIVDDLARPTASKKLYNFTNSFLNGYLKEGYKFTRDEFVKEETFALLIDQAYKSSLNMSLNTNFNTDIFTAKNVIDNVVVGVLMAPLAGIGAGIRRGMNGSSKKVLTYGLIDEVGYEPVWNAITDIKEGIESGAVTGADKAFINEMYQELPVAMSLKKPDGVSDIKWLSTKHLVSRKILLENQQKGSPKAMSSMFQSQIDQLDSQINSVMSTSDDVLTEAMVKNGYQILTNEKGLPYFSQIKPTTDATQESARTQQEGVPEGRITEYAPAQQGEQVQATQPTAAVSDSDISRQGQVGPTIEVPSADVIMNNVLPQIGTLSSIPLESEDGATFNADGTTYTGTGLVVPALSINTTTDELTPQMVADFMDKHRDKLATGNFKVGIYKFPNSNRASIDLNIIVDPKNEAQALDFARQAGHESIYNIGVGNVKTGATGENVAQFNDQQLISISRDLSSGIVPNVSAMTIAPPTAPPIAPPTTSAAPAITTAAPTTQVPVEAVAPVPSQVQVRQLTPEENTRMSDARSMTQQEFSTKYPDVSSEAYESIKQSGFDNEQDFESWKSDQVNKANQIASSIRESMFSGVSDMQILSKALYQSWSKVVPGLSMVWNNYASNVEKAGFPSEFKNYAGFYDPTTKTVYLNPDKIGLDTPIHEFGHVWYAVANVVDKSITERGRNLIRGTEYEARVRAIDEYKDLTDEEIEEEALILAIGERGAGIIDAARKNNFMTWLSDLFNFVAKKFGININIENLNLGEFLDLAAMDILSGGNVLINTSSPVEVEATGIKPSIVSAERLAMSYPAVKNRLDTAKQMTSNNADPNAIWESTGMEFVDGAWMTELNYDIKTLVDFNKVSDDLDRSGNGFAMFTLGKVFSYPELYKAYPELKRINVKVAKYNEGYIAGYSPNQNMIRINVDKDILSYVGGDYTSSILHEIQHYIQNKEGWSFGTSPKLEFESAKERVSKIYENAGFSQDAEKIMSLEYGKKYTGDDLNFYKRTISAANLSYLLSRGEIQSRNAEARFADATKRQYSPAETETAVMPKASVKSIMGSNAYDRFMTQDESSYYFFHWSSEERKTIDPKKFGNNRITSREERIARPSAAFFYTRPDFRESGVGDYGHVVKIAKDKVYPATADPLNFFDEAKALFEKSHPGMAFGPNQQIGWITKVANMKGYEMVVAKWGKQLRAETTNKVKPEWYQIPEGWGIKTNPKYTKLKRGTVKLSIASKYNVDKIRSEVKAGNKIAKGLAVYTRGGKKIIEGTSDLSLEYVKNNAPEVFISNANIILQYPIIKGVKDISSVNTTEEAQEIYDIFSSQISDNLKYLIEEFAPEFRDISTLWYDGANIIAQNFSKKYGISAEQAAGIIASLSPQKDWYQNVRLAEMVMMAFRENPSLNKSMIDKQISVISEGEKPKLKDIKKAQDAYNKNKTKENKQKLEDKKDAHKKYMADALSVVDMLKGYVGKTLNEVPDNIKPYIVRLSNEVNTTKDYDILSPDGRVIGVAMKSDGITKAKIAWGSYTEIGKAVSIMVDGSQENINKSLGQMHKIRNFYNNIIDPMSNNNDVTMDTHAVAAALLMPLSGNSKEVGQNFGTGTSNSGPFGIKGLYYAFADGYKNAAESYGLLPRQVQSITWEAVRGLFTDTFKSNKDNVNNIKSIWDLYANKKIDINETRARINKSAGGIKDPTWAESASGGRGTVQIQPGVSVKKEGVGRGTEVSGRIDVGDRSGRAGSGEGSAILEAKPSISSRYGLDDGWAERAVNEARTMLNNGMFQITENTATGQVGFTLSINGNPYGVYPSMQDAESQRDTIIKTTIMKGYPQVSEMIADNVLFNAKRRDFTKPLNPSSIQGLAPSARSRGYVGDTRTRSRKIKDATRRFFTRYFTFSRGLPKEILNLKESLGGKLSYQVSVAESMVKDMKKVAKKIGFEDWATFDQAIRDYRTYNPTNPFWISGQPGYSPAANTNPAFFNLPEEIRKYVVSMRSLMDGMSEQLVRNGLVSPDMALVLESNMGKYVHRSYALFTMGNEWSKKVKNNKKIIDTAHENLFQLYYTHLAATNPNLSQQELISQANEEADKEINRILDSKKPFFGRDEASFLPYRNTGSLKQRQEMPQWLRDLMGEYTDPGTAFLLSVGETATLLQTSDYLAKLRDFGLGTVFFEEGNRPADATYRIGSMGQMLKPLEGLYTTKEMYNLLVDSETNRSSNFKWAWRLMNLNKMMKTVFSPLTQTKNFVSNTGFALHNGHFDVTALSEAWSYFRRQVSNNKSQDVIESLRPLFERGVLNQSLTAKELAAIFRTDDFEQYVLDNADKTGIQDYLTDPGKASRVVMRGASRIYQASDDFWKIYAYYNEQRSISKVLYNKDYESLNQSEKDTVDNESADRVMNTYPTYDRVLEIFKTVSKTGVLGNFIAFRAEVFRVMANSYAYAYNDIRNGIKEKNNRMVAAGTKRLLGMAVYNAIRMEGIYLLAKYAGLGVSGLASSIWGGGDDEDKEKMAINSFVPDWARSDDKIYDMSKIKDGIVEYYTFSSVDPYSTIYNIFNAYKYGNEYDEKGGSIAASLEVVAPFVEPEMTLRSFASAISNKDSYGFSIYNDDDTYLKKAFDGSLYIAKETLTPGAFTWINRMFYRRDEEGKLQFGFNPSELYTAPIGARPYVANIGRKWKSELYQSSKNVFSDISSDFRRNARDNKSYEDDANFRYNRQILRLHKMYTDAIRLGYQEEKLLQAMRESRLDRRTFMAIITGETFRAYDDDGKINSRNPED